MSEVNIKKIDWLSVFILSILIALGLGNIYSSSQTYLLESIFSLNPFTKQLFFSIISLCIFLFIQILPVNFFIKYSSILYILSILSLIGLFVFGNEVNGIHDDVLKECDFTLEIPQFGDKHSFNVSVSYGIVAYAFFDKFSI